MLARRLSALAIPILLLAAGCSTTATTAPAGAAGQPRSGGTLTWAIETEPLTLNPHQYAQAKARLLVWNSFESLLTYDDQGALVPWLATGWQASADGLTYTLTLRDGVTFTDGTPFDAEAVKANFDKLREQGYAPGVAAVQLRNLKGVEVVDPRTVRLVLTAPDVLILDFLASPQGAQVSPKSLREAANLKAGGLDVVGTGPFILDRYVPGQELHYKRNPAYDWAPPTADHTGPAHLDGITYRFLKESAVRIGALTSGQVQLVEGVPATDVPLIDGNPQLRLIRELNSGSAFSYYFNVSRPPFDDLRVRQAFREAVDVPTLLTSVYRDTATRAWSLVSPASPFYDKRLEASYGGDAAKANSLLDQAGWTQRDAEGYRVKDGSRLTVRLFQSAPFVRDRRDVLAQAVQAAVKQSAGIDLKVSLVDQGTAQEAFDNNSYEVFENSRADTDAGAALNLLLHSGGGINRIQVNDPGIDKLLEQGQASADLAERARIYAELQQLVVAEQALVLPLYAPADQIAASTTVGGVRFEPTAGVPASAYDLWIGK
ncbi:ABC transporter substrate-binding protein [Micromonospora endophytica]|uniref:Peptide ABC transporter n=1 Tax=Micromonospora endophytica TaxID=515350 RepID=A0A2W2E5K2_9ACTN|nr:ABC transporter substrate-binding protein [Micromonospora endophytica]PZG00174.1 peptide ABC transporter [Micromonospora endophytica]RIW47962.1 ABC transporter substrate-binding protein [Micromonospora endophytica]BCJ62347.1 peptide ABC transporter substrate-binding protein [Micromonospora endophytica]